jgi:ubiquinone/menaquinone biosynthesis C-methylase UbiE
MAYHEKQWLNPKASTLEFIEQIKSLVQPGSAVLDIGCGGGAATYEISKSFLATDFHGMDFDPKLIEMASNTSTRLQAPNLSFSVGDIHNLEKSKFDGVISL